MTVMAARMKPTTVSPPVARLSTTKYDNDHKPTTTASNMIAPSHASSLSQRNCFSLSVLSESAFAFGDAFGGGFAADGAGAGAAVEAMSVPFIPDPPPRRKPDSTCVSTDLWVVSPP